MTNALNESMSNAPENFSTCGITDTSSQSSAIQTFCYALIFLVSLIGNSLVIHIARRAIGKTNQGSTTNLLIANMASSDLLISIIAIPRMIVETLVGQEAGWFLSGLAGQISCKCVFFLQDISTAVSIQSLLVISMDQFVAVVFPFRRLVGIKTCMFVVVPAIWSIAVALCSPYFYTFKLRESGNRTDCLYSWAPAFEEKRTQEVYYLLQLVFLISLPLVILSVMYSILIWQLRAKNETARTNARMRENWQVIKKVLAIILVYMICLSPINVYAILFYFVWDWQVPCGVTAFQWASYFILYSNSALNPVVYFTFSERYRKELRNILTRTVRSEPSRQELRTV